MATVLERLRLCRATQSARASALATVPIASTSTASYSPKINVDVIGLKPSASLKGFGRSPTIAFPAGNAKEDVGKSSLSAPRIDSDGFAPVAL